MTELAGIGLLYAVSSVLALARQVHAVANYRRMRQADPAGAAGLASVIRSTRKGLIPE